LRTNLDGTELTIDLLHDDSWFRQLAVPPKVFLAEGTKAGDGAVREVTWERIEPGHFRAKANLEHGRLTPGRDSSGRFPHSLLDQLLVGGSPEWSFDRSRIEELRQVSILSGGAERINLAEVWKQPVRKEFASIQSWLLVLALFMVVADALVTRMGWSWGLIDFTKVPKRNEEGGFARCLEPVGSRPRAGCPGEEA